MNRLQTEVLAVKEQIIAADDSNFLKHWTDKEIETVETMIFTYFRNKEIVTHRNERIRLRSHEQLLDVFGLPFVSSGEYACLVANCNTEVFISNDSHLVIWLFAIDNSGNLVMITKDETQNETHFRIGSVIDKSVLVLKVKTFHYEMKSQNRRWSETRTVLADYNYLLRDSPLRVSQ